MSDMIDKHGMSELFRAFNISGRSQITLTSYVGRGGNRNVNCMHIFPYNSKGVPSQIGAQ